MKDIFPHIFQSNSCSCVLFCMQYFSYHDPCSQTGFISTSLLYHLNQCSLSINGLNIFTLKAHSNLPTVWGAGKGMWDVLLLSITYISRTVVVRLLLQTLLPVFLEWTYWWCNIGNLLLVPCFTPLEVCILNH